MSLWDKWEREKLEQQGIKVDHHSDVKISDSPIPVSMRRQIVLIGTVFLTCLLVVLLGLALSSYFGNSRWNSSYLLQLFSSRQQQRTEMSRSSRR